MMIKTSIQKNYSKFKYLHKVVNNNLINKYCRLEKKIRI